MDLVKKDEWFNELISECQGILVEFGFRSNLERVRMYHELGSRIVQDNDNFQRDKIYGKHLTENIANILHVSSRTVQYAISFAQKYPSIDWDSGELGGLPYGKSLTWTKVVHELLPENPKKEKPVKKCPYCGGLLT